MKISFSNLIVVTGLKRSILFVCVARFLSSYMPQFRRCWVPNCRNSITGVQISSRLFMFPRNVKRCILWLKAIGDETLASCSWSVLVRNRYVCAQHFMPHMITPTKRVSWNAVPVLFTDVRPELPDTAIQAFLETVPKDRCPSPDTVTEGHLTIHGPRTESPSSDDEVTDEKPSVLDICEEANISSVSSTYDPPQPQYQESPDRQDHFPGADTSEDHGEFDSFVDSVTIDHDYFAPMVSEKLAVPQKLVLPKTLPVPQKLPVSGYIKTPVGYINAQHFCMDNQEDLLSNQCVLENLKREELLSKQRTLENLKRELCRLCGQKGSVLSPLFETASDTSQDMPTASKIDMYLPIKVKVEDSLPFCICSECLSVLNRWHEFYTTSVAADAVLSKTFGKECNVLTVNNTGLSKFQQNAETQTEDLPLCASTQNTPVVALTLAITCSKVQQNAGTQTEEMSPDEDICKYCGESKAGILREDNLFKDEFDKNFHSYRNTFYKCSFCCEIFKNSADRKSHIEMCRQLSTICELCGREVPCRKNLKRHKLTKHSAHREFLCDKCDKFFSSAAGLKLHHKRAHSDEFRSGKYCCELCCASFMREIYYLQHKKKHEMGQVKTAFQIENFRQDVNSEGSGNGDIYVCPVCQAEFNDMTSIAVHLADKKKIKCSSCRKVLYSEKSIFLHVCEMWTCQYCSKSFDQRVKWMLHERWHTGEKPIKCRKCDATFRTWGSRRFHEQKHAPSASPSFQCAYCGKCFRNKYVFQDHVSCHEGKEFPCQFCNKNFSGRKCLKKHINAFHKDLKEAVCSNE